VDVRTTALKAYTKKKKKKKKKKKQVFKHPDTYWGTCRNLGILFLKINESSHFGA